jgi:HEAT repeat protein
MLIRKETNKMSKLLDIIRSDIIARKARRKGVQPRIEDRIRTDLFSMASRNYMNILISCLNDEYFRTRYQVSKEFSYMKCYVADILGEIGDPAAVGPLGIALKDDSSAVCISAANALCKIGDARAVPFLVAGLEDNSVQPPWQQIDLDARYAIANALISLNNPWGAEIGRKVLAALDKIVGR